MLSGLFTAALYWLSLQLLTARDPYFFKTLFTSCGSSLSKLSDCSPAIELLVAWPLFVMVSVPNHFNRSQLNCSANGLHWVSNNLIHLTCLSSGGCSGFPGIEIRLVSTQDRDLYLGETVSCWLSAK